MNSRIRHLLLWGSVALLNFVALALAGYFHLTHPEAKVDWFGLSSPAFQLVLAVVVMIVGEEKSEGS